MTEQGFMLPWLVLRLSNTVSSLHALNTKEKISSLFYGSVSHNHALLPRTSWLMTAKVLLNETDLSLIFQNQSTETTVGQLWLRGSAVVLQPEGQWHDPSLPHLHAEWPLIEKSAAHSTVWMCVWMAKLDCKALWVANKRHIYTVYRQFDIDNWPVTSGMTRISTLDYLIICLLFFSNYLSFGLDWK